MQLIRKHRGTIIGILVMIAVITFFCRGYISEPGLGVRMDIGTFFSRFSQGEVFDQWFQTWASDEILSGPRAGICFPLFSPLYYLLVKLQLFPVSQSIYIFFLYLLSGIFCYLLVYYFTKNVYASTIAGTFYAINWFSRSIISNTCPLATGLVLFPILFLLFDRVLEKRRFKDLIFFSIFTVLYVTSSDYHNVYMAFIFLVLFALFHTLLSGRGKWLTGLANTAKSSVISIAMILGLLSYELVPLLRGVTPDILSVGRPLEITDNFLEPMAVVFGLIKRTGCQVAFYSDHWILGILIGTLALSALLFRRNKYTIFFTFTALIGIFLAKGTNPPFGSIYTWLFNNVPAFNTIRDVGRWHMLTVLSYAFLLGVSIKSVLGKLDGLVQSYRRQGSLSITLSGISVDIKFISGKLRHFLKRLGSQTLLAIVLTGVLITMILLNVLQLITTYQDKGYDPNRYLEYIEAKEAYAEIASQGDDINTMFLIYDFSIPLVKDSEPPDLEGWHISRSPIRSLMAEGRQPVTAFVDPETFLEASQFGRFMASHIEVESMADLSRILGSYNIAYFVIDGRAQEYIAFFQKSDSYRQIYNGKTVAVFQNLNALPHFYATPASAQLAGGLYSLLPIQFVPNFDFSNVNLLPQGHSQSSNFFILYDADAENFAGLKALESNGVIQRLDLEKNSETPHWWGTCLVALKGWEAALVVPEHCWYVSDWATVKGEFVSGNFHIRAEDKATIQVPFSVGKSGNYEMWLRIAFAMGRGRLEALVDGKELPGFPLTPGVDFDYGFRFVRAPLYLEKGQHILELTNDGAGPNDIDEVFLIESDAADSLFSSASERITGGIIYYLEAEKLFGLSDLEDWFIYTGKVITDDEQSLFWQVLDEEVVSITDNSETKVHGDDSLKIEVTGKKKFHTTLAHYYDSSQDWSDIDYISLYFYGRDTKHWFGVVTQTETEPQPEWLEYRWCDNFTGWKRLVFRITAIDRLKLGWNRIDKISITMDREPAVAATWYLDDLRIGSLTERGAAQAIKSGHETSQITTDFTPLQEGNYRIAIRGFAAEPPETTQYIPARIIADDEQMSFWKALKPDVVSISDSAEVQSQGEDSLEIKIIEEERKNATILYHRYDTAQDWSDIDYISLYFYGRDTDIGWALSVSNLAEDEEEYVDFNWTDDFTGWKQLVFPIDKQKLDWSRIEKVGIVLDREPLTDTWYLDNLTVGNMETVPIGPTPEQAKLRLNVDGQEQTLGGFTTELSWLEVGPVYLDDERQIIEMSNEGEVVIDKILLYPADGQFDVDSLFNIDNNTSLSYEKLSPTRYQIHVNTDRPFWMVFSEIYHPLWFAHIDSESIQPVENYLGFNSFYIAKIGDYDFILEFKGQQYLKQGAIISCASLGVMLAVGIFSEVWARRKRRSHTG